jgi:hypothetical protein
MKNETDLFGNPAGPAQQSLFGEGEDRLTAPAQKLTPDAAEVRRELHALLAKARAAASMPWPEREARMWQTVFPNMANWLPQEEAEQLRLEFMREIERLRAA